MAASSTFKRNLIVRTGPILLAVFLQSAGLYAQDGAGARTVASGPSSLSEDQLRDLIHEVADADQKNDQK
jgi:hypothetical protein